METNDKDLAKVFNGWKPNPRQAEFLSVPDSVKEAFYGGGAGSGKSDVLLFYGLSRKWHEVPVWKQVFIRRTYPEIKNEILGRSREIYTKFGATFNKTDMIWTFPRMDQYGGRGLTNGGAQIFLGHCEHEDDVHKYDSMQISLFTPDELTSFTFNIYSYIGFERVRSPQGYNLPAIIRTAGMPGGIGQSWVKKRFIDPCREGGVIVEGKGGNKRIYIHATYLDNKYIDPTYGKSLDARPEAERKAKKFGDWDAYQGSVFEEFRNKWNPEEPENALHVVAPFEIPAYWPRFIIGDWGFRAMTWIGFFAVSPTGRLYLYRELTWTKTKIAEWGAILKNFIEVDESDSQPFKIIKFCKSAGQDRGNEHTIQGEIENAIDRPIELTSNTPGSRLTGKMLMHEYLRWTSKPRPNPKDLQPFSEELAARILRMQGENAYINYLEQYQEPTEELLPKYQIFCCDKREHDGCSNCCPEAINAIVNCMYAENKKDKLAEDVAEFAGDDPYDGQRYGIDTAEKYMKESADEFTKFQKQTAYEQRLKDTGNWTSFYRQAEKMYPSVKPLTVVKTFHGKRH